MGAPFLMVAPGVTGRVGPAEPGAGLGGVQKHLRSCYCLLGAMLHPLQEAQLQAVSNAKATAELITQQQAAQQLREHPEWARSVLRVDTSSG